MAARFQIDWLMHPDFKDWIQEIPSDGHKARCSLCKTSFSLSNMGRRALRSHAAGIQHQRRVSAAKKSVSIQCFAMKEKEPQKDPQTSSAGCVASSSMTMAAENVPLPAVPVSYGLKSFLVNDNVTKAEILWCLNTVVTHKSMRMSEKDITLMKTMFPDSEVAQKIQLKRSKIGYSILYGIAPFFKNKLTEKLSKCRYFSIGFDESLNKVAQRIQMDINVRFWCDEKDEVSSRYLTSAFLGRSTADDLRHHFKNALSSINLSTILQISMDGPNVNLKFLRDLKAEMALTEDQPVLLNLGTCGLHTLHGAFKTGVKATKWDIISFLRALHNLFKNVPARRALYTEYSDSIMFPQKFCSVRWLQNGDVAQRAIDILPHVKKFVVGTRKNNNEPMCASFRTVSCLIEDPLIEAKLAFFKSLSAEIEPFLREYQTDAPLVPFLYSSLQSIVINIMGKFVKESVLKETTSIHKLNFMDAKNLLDTKEVDLGYGTRSALKKSNKKKVTEQMIFQFKKECALCLKVLTSKLLERSPLVYSLTKAVTCFDPAVTIDRYIRKKRVKSLLTILEEHKWITDCTADKADREFEHICDQPYVQEELKRYTRQDCRIDVFWRGIFKKFENSESISAVMKIVMSLSHGNANVERGFSVNSECLVENLKQETLVAQRLIYDTIISTVGDVNSFNIPKSLIHSFRNSRALLTEETKKRQREMQDKETEEARKKRIKVATKELEQRVAKIKEDSNKEVIALMEQIKALKD